VTEQGRYATSSAYFASVAEHVLLADVLTYAWYIKRVELQVLHAEVDVAGYDLVLSDHRVIRHIQLKAGQNSPVPISLRLCDAPSGCVVWVRLDEASNGWRPDVRYRFLGGGPGEPLDASDLGERVTSSPRTRKPRLGHRDVNWTHLKGPLTASELYDELFGSAEASSP
jgi:hypothetical protein